MNEHIKNSTFDVSRREIVQGGASLAFAFSMAGMVGPVASAYAAEGTKLNAYVTVGTDNIVTIISPVAEMGQGTMTSLPLILAEEMDADWKTVRVEFAPPNPKVYGHPHKILHGAQITAASVSVPGYFMPLRIAGAQARRVLIDAVAAEWKVPAWELSTDKGAVVHKKSKRRISYGDVAKFAKVPEQVPNITEADLKKPSEFKLIGKKDIGRLDVPGKTNGKAQYGIDVQVPGMVFASVLEAPMDGAKAQVANLDEVSKLKGVMRVVPLPFGVAVIGDSVEATRKGRNMLNVTWDTTGAAAVAADTVKAKEAYEAQGMDPAAPSITEHKVGDAARTIAAAAKTVEAKYWTEYCYHAQMEPMNAVASVSEDGQSAEIWTGTQFSALAAVVISGILKTTPEKVKVHNQLLGGGYGRRIWPDAAVQAAIISNAIKKPVKLILTREDDIAAARPRPMTHHVLKAGLDAQGNLTGWYHRLVSENVDAVAAPPRFQATGGKDYIGARGLDQEQYSMPNVQAEYVRQLRGMRVHAWRGIGAGYNKFAAEGFLDEVAAAGGKDPLELRLALAKDNPRTTACLKAVAEMCDYKKKREAGRALGIASADYHGTYSAGAAEVSVDQSSGKIKVHNYWVACDPGLVIQPDNVHAQLESAVVYGLSAALIEELTVKDGVIQETNFNDYPVLRMSDLPQIFTRVVASNNAPGGMGEIGVCAVAPAIANAVFNLTGKRLRHLPMSAERVKKAFA